MARGVTLEEIVQKLRAECRFSVNPSAGTNNLNYLKQIINRNYETIYENYDWPFKKITRNDAGKTLSAGQRYYDFPAELDQDRPKTVWYKQGSVWIQLTQGITIDDYSVFDSDSDVRSDPPIKWDYHGDNQFEIWPAPATDGGEIRFEGMRAFRPLVSDTDRILVDDMVVILYSAGEILKGSKQADGDTKIELAKDRLLTLRSNLSSDEPVILGGGAGGMEEDTVSRRHRRFEFATGFSTRN